ncbi:protein TIFY 9-like isoform X3 [Momordica charantia]|nr:protein TIFY 9-like isoform X2 [Momordica charantia]XP_022145866.1 protein TIFY 9-like isoform X3 [Momordica charantia]
MSTPTVVELDFFAMENHATTTATSRSRRQTLFRRQRSLKDIQSAISKIKPEILKSVIASENRTTDCRNRIAPPTPEFADHNLSPTSSRMTPQNAPLTIFYNETVAVFHVSREEAESILTFAEKRSCSGKLGERGRSTAEIPSNESQQLVDVDPNLEDQDLPLARKRSLQRFLEKRKER